MSSGCTEESPRRRRGPVPKVIVVPEKEQMEKDKKDSRIVTGKTKDNFMVFTLLKLF